MTAIEPLTSDDEIRFPSLASLRSAHTELLREFRANGGTADIFSKIEIFIRRGRATGALLDTDADRWEAQSQLDYWATQVYQPGYEPPDSTLDEFDPQLAPAIPDHLCPYMGLDAFQELNQSEFFGRKQMVEELVGKLSTARLLAVLGSSGSGKSSLVRAGLIPALKRGALSGSAEWIYFSPIVPGSKPLTNLARLFMESNSDSASLEREADLYRQDPSYLAKVVSEKFSQPVVLVIDQFEEIFTLCTDEVARQRFVDQLMGLCRASEYEHRVIITLRSDFETNIARLPDLQAMFQKTTLRVTPLNATEMRESIEAAALRIGLKFEEGVVDALLNDTLGEPAALPLLQFTLLKLWENRERNRITWEAYKKLGGGLQALARSADELYNDLIPEEQFTMRRILLKMVRPGEGLEVTSNRIPRWSLYLKAEDQDRIDRVLTRLIQARLVRVSQGDVAVDEQVEVAHEALIRNWPRLVEWLEEERVTLRQRQRLTVAAEQWQRLGREPSALWRGVLLEEARRYDDLNHLEDQFINASYTRGRRIQVILISAVSMVIVLLLTAVIVFSRQSNANARLAKNASARLLGTQAMLIQSIRSDIPLLMSVQANKLEDSFLTRSSLLSTLQCCADSVISFLGGHRDSVWDVAFSPDSKTLASAGNDGLILLWDVETRKQLKSLPHDTSAIVYTLAFSPTDNILAAGDGTGSIILYDTQTWQPVGTPLRGHESSVLSIKFSKDGQWLISGGTDGKVLVWDVRKRKLYKTFLGHTSWVWDVAISADNKTVASVGRPFQSDDKTLYLWTLDADAPVQSVGVPTGTLVSVAFNDNLHSRILVTGDTNGNIFVWDLVPWRSVGEVPQPSARLKTGFAATGAVWGLAFMPHHDLDIVTARDGGYMNKNRISLSGGITETKLQRQSLGMAANKLGSFRLDISPNGKFFAAAGQDGLVSLWRAANPSSIIWHPTQVLNVQIPDTGSTIAMSIDKNGGLYRWDYRKQKIVSRLALHTNVVLRSTISNDGTKIVTGYDDGAIILWDGQTGKKLFKVTKHLAPITSLAFSPDGKQLASSDREGNVILWNVTADKLAASHRFSDQQKVSIPVLLFSDDGKMLVGGGCAYPFLFPSVDCGRGAIYLWDTTLKLQYQLPGNSGFVFSLAFNPADANELATGTRDGMVTIWNLHDKSPRLTLRLNRNDVTSLAFSPDGKLLAVGAAIYKLFLYDPRTGQNYGQAFVDHDATVIALRFSPDGNQLLSASSDGTIIIHDMNPKDWQVRACQLANRNLTPIEWEQYIGDVLSYQSVCPQFPIES